MNLLKKIKGLFEKEYLSTLEVREIIIPELKIRNDFRNQINFPPTVKNIIFGDIILSIIKEQDPKSVEILEASLNIKSFGYKVKYLRDRLKESQND